MTQLRESARRVLREFILKDERNPVIRSYRMWVEGVHPAQHNDPMSKEEISELQQRREVR